MWSQLECKRCGSDSVDVLRVKVVNRLPCQGEKGVFAKSGELICHKCAERGTGEKRGATVSRERKSAQANPFVLEKPKPSIENVQRGAIWGYNPPPLNEKARKIPQKVDTLPQHGQDDGSAKASISLD